MMSSSCLSGGGGTPSGFKLHLVYSTRSPSSSPASSSLTSTLSDSITSPQLSVSTRKPRTLRKRPNQTYYEAAALLSTAFPNVFSPAPLPHRPPLPTSSPHDPSQFFFPFRILEDESPSLIYHPTQDQKLLPILKETGPSPSCDRSCQTPDDCEIQSEASDHLHHEYEEDFDAESMLDEELEEGIIDSIMGEKSGTREADKSETGESRALKLGHSMGRRSPTALLGLGGRLGGIGKARGGSGWRDVGQVNWCNFLTVDVNEISPKLNPNPASSSKNNLAAEKKRKKVEKSRPAADVWRNRTELVSPATLGLGVKKMLKLDYKNVLEAWTGRGSPFPDDTPASDIAGKVDRMMELIVAGVRHREKRRSRPFTTTKKKMRHIPMHLHLQLQLQ